MKLSQPSLAYASEEGDELPSTLLPLSDGVKLKPASLSDTCRGWLKEPFHEAQVFFDVEAEQELFYRGVSSAGYGQWSLSLVSAWGERAGFYRLLLTTPLAEVKQLFWREVREKSRLATTQEEAELLQQLWLWLGEEQREDFLPWVVGLTEAWLCLPLLEEAAEAEARDESREETEPSPQETEPSAQETEPSPQETQPSPQETQPSPQETDTDEARQRACRHSKTRLLSSMLTLQEVDPCTGRNSHPFLLD